MSIIHCPTGANNDSIKIDLKSILESERRLHEVAITTKDKAPELLASFNLSWLELHGHIVYLENERNIADRELRKRRSVIVLDVAPQILKDKGLANPRSPAGNEDLREAVINQDAEYLAIEERYQKIEAVIELLRGKLKAFEMAYNSVKKIISDLPSFYNNYDPRLTHGTPSSTEEDGVFSGFGKAR